jgi:hypothetical protein
MRLLRLFLIIPILFAPIHAQTKTIDFVELEKTIEAELRTNREDGKDYALVKIGKDKFSYEQGEAVFTPNAKGEVEHVSFGLYSAQKK